MENNVVRLVELDIKHMKNVRHGNIEFTSRRKGSILGIYGQNGSGKTAVVDCMLLLKNLITGKRIPSYFFHYISAGCNTASVKYCFNIRTDEAEDYAEYEIELMKNGENSFCISSEKLSTKNINQEKRTKLTVLFDYHKGEKELFRPLKYYRYFQKNMEQMIALGVAQQATENYNDESQQPEVSSFLFSKKAQEVFKKANGDAAQISSLSGILQTYGINNLAVIANTYHGLVSLNLNTLPINIDWPDSSQLKPSGVMLQLTDVNILPKDIYNHVEATIRQINIVLKSLIPDTELEIYNSFDKLTEHGKEGVQFEIATLRGDTRIPLLYESAGIKKLISICSNLVACYNRESYCLVVDELDSGIYEYLLGECLEVMQAKAKGQLIFTSHNLRPLEVLENDSLIYTTVNPENRFVKSVYIKNTQNTRLSYLRSIKLGGQKEKLYNETNIYEIELAMRKAGRVEVHD